MVEAVRAVPPPTGAEVFALLEHVLSSARLRLRREARPITFELPGETWRFEPAADGALFSPGAAAAEGAPLVVRTTPAVLARLLTDPAFELGPEDPASFEGELDDLLLLVAAFEAAGSAIGVRAAPKRSS